MNESKHTPGPWAVGINTAQRVTSIGDEFLGVGTGSGRVVCRVTSLDLEDEQDGYNASLIAAAPDLLAICEAILESATRLPGTSEWNYQYVIPIRRIEEIKAVLFKAKGGER